MLVSFLVFAYNHERFIGAALEAAFAQTYEPMEIIVTDDGSTDLTAERIRALVAGYSGSKVVRLILHPTNAGVANAFNTAVAAARGELIVSADGDDVSLPTRTSRIAEEFLRNDKLMCLASNAEVIDTCGTHVRLWYKTPPPKKTLESFEVPHTGVLGATFAFRKSLRRIFGPVDQDLIYVDRVTPLQAAIAGELGFVDEVLVRYRAHETNLVGRADWDRATREGEERWTNLRNTRMVAVLRNRLRDIDTGITRFPAIQGRLQSLRDTTRRLLLGAEAIDELSRGITGTAKLRQVIRVSRSYGYRPRPIWGVIKRFYFPRAYFAKLPGASD